MATFRKLLALACKQNPITYTNRVLSVKKSNMADKKEEKYNPKVHISEDAHWAAKEKAAIERKPLFEYLNDLILSHKPKRKK